MFKAILFILLSIPIGLLAFVIFWVAGDFKLGCIVGLSVFGFFNILGFLCLYFQKTITSIDVFLPIPIAILWSFLLSFFSFGANVFYMPAVIGSSILLTLSLIKQKQNPLISRKWLVLPALVFIYEMLPINIPGPVDDYLAFGSATIVTVLGYLIKPKLNN
jgi:hypothetical protein